MSGSIISIESPTDGHLLCDTFITNKDVDQNFADCAGFTVGASVHVETGTGFIQGSASPGPASVSVRTEGLALLYKALTGGERCLVKYSREMINNKTGLHEVGLEIDLIDCVIGGLDFDGCDSLDDGGDQNAQVHLTLFYKKIIVRNPPQDKETEFSIEEKRR